MTYLVVKWLHVLSSAVLFGTGIGSMYYMLVASRTRDAHVAAAISRYVVLADRMFTVTTIVVQPVTGIALAWLASIPLTTRWMLWSFVLYFVAGACWLPVIWMQIRMRDLAQQAVRSGTGLPDRYWKLLRVWVALGVPAFSALVIVFWLMVAKPV
jgi:uncharacterized membrane protein